MRKSRPLQQNSLSTIITNIQLAVLFELIMMLLKLLFVVVLCAVTVSSFDMKAGEKVHKKMVFFKRVKTVALPLVKRIAFLSYSDPDNCVIKGIEVLDNDFSLATANITDGGVGFSHVTIRMKSQRSHPLNYQVEIYV